MDKVKLFCIPYAGGSATVYNQWKSLLNKSIELCPLELKGRGKRFGAGFYNDFDDAVNDLFELVKNDLDHSEFAIWGHSMGSLLAYELGQKILAEKQKDPVHIFFSGRKPPYPLKLVRFVHKLSDEEFKKEVLKYGGNTKEIFEDKNLASLFLPILRADFRVLETYKFKENRRKFECDISVLYSSEDETTKPDEINEWASVTQKNCKIYDFNGGHFFINDCKNSVVEIINSVLAK